MEALTFYNQARQALAQASQIDEVKDIRDKAEALRAYTKQVGESLEMQNWCAEIKIRAERRAGELLEEMDKRDGGDAMRARSDPQTEVPPRLQDLGISRDQSHRYQTIAKLPDSDFEAHLEETKAAGKELTSAAIYRQASTYQKGEQVQAAVAKYPELASAGIPPAYVPKVAERLDALDEPTREAQRQAIQSGTPGVASALAGLPPLPDPRSAHAIVRQELADNPAIPWQKTIQALSAELWQLMHGPRLDALLARWDAEARAGVVTMLEEFIEKLETIAARIREREPHDQDAMAE